MWLAEECSTVNNNFGAAPHDVQEYHVGQLGEGKEQSFPEHWKWSMHREGGNPEEENFQSTTHMEIILEPQGKCI